jgi:uncharacterized membrane protein YidH (DUF202 family)
VQWASLRADLLPFFPASITLPMLHVHLHPTTTSTTSITTTNTTTAAAVIIIIIIIIIITITLKYHRSYQKEKRAKPENPSYKAMLFHVSGSTEQKSTFVLCESSRG